MLYCEDCKKPYPEHGVDTMFSDEMWNKIMGHETGAGTLCATCALIRAEKLNLGTLAYVRFDFEMVDKD